jgi:CubicO group peptidase (beta-lactamase class C family)
VSTESAAAEADVTPLSAADVTAAPAAKPTSAARTVPAEAVRSAQRPDEPLEMQQVAQAEQLLERAPASALALVRQGDQRFAHGYFQQERAYIAIMALIRLGRIDEARVRAASFAKQFPALPYGARIRSALEAKGAAP